MNEWTDFVALVERPILKHLVSNIEQDDVFYDVGANVGLYSCLVASVVNHPVIAFEPHPGNANRLQENARVNDARIKVFECALSDATGEAELTVTLEKIGSAGHTLLTCDDEADDTVPVTRERGDDFIAAEDVPAPTVLKIDVEGTEYEVLKGLDSSLARSQCRLVYCETHPDRLSSRGRGVVDVAETLEGYGFSITERFSERAGGVTTLVAQRD